MEFLYNKGSWWALQETRKWPVRWCDHQTGATLCWPRTHVLTWIRSHTSVVTTPGREEAALPLLVSCLRQILLCQSPSLCSVVSLLAPATEERASVLSVALWSTCRWGMAGE